MPPALGVHAAEIVRLDALGAMTGDITPETLSAAGFVRRGRPVKILANGEVSTAVTVRGVMVSAGARAKIVAAGGRVDD